MNRLWHTFETGQADGTTVSTGNSGTGGTAFTGVTIGTGASLTYAAGAGARGSLCLRVVTPPSPATAVQSFATWDSTAFGTATRVYGRATVTPATFPGQVTIVRVRAGSTQLFRVTVNPDGAIALRNTANTQVAASTTTMTAGATWRVAWDVTIGASATGVLYIYTDPTSSTPTETLTASAQNFGTGSANDGAFGQVANMAGVDLKLDDVMLTDEGLPGPAEQSRSIGDSVGAGDAVAHGGVSNPNRSVAEGVTLADAATRGGMTQPRTLAEAIAVDAVPTRVTSRSATASDAVGLADAASRGATSRARSVGESLTLADQVVRTATALAGAGETLTFADLVQRGTFSRTRAIGETLGLADAPTRTTSRARSITDAVTTSDQAVRGAVERARLLAEGLTLVDVVSSSRDAASAGAEAIAFADSAVRVMARARAAGDTLVFADQVVRGVFLRPRSVADSAIVVDQLTRVTSRKASGADFLGLADQGRRGSWLRVRAVGETLVLVDQVARGNRVRTPAFAVDALVLVDQVARVLYQARELDELVELDDAVTLVHLGVVQGRITLTAGGQQRVTVRAGRPHIALTVSRH